MSCIVGGAIVTPLMGAVSDVAGSIRVAYIVPMLCFMGVGVYAHRTSSRENDVAQGHSLGQAAPASSGDLKTAMLKNEAP